MLLETQRGTKYIGGEAFDALARFGRDILIAGSGLPRSSVRRVLDAAAYAFSSEDSDRSAAWMHLVLAVRGLLGQSLIATQIDSSVERGRLQAFVDENSDLCDGLAESAAS